MKLAGQKVQGPNVEIVVFPRPDREVPTLDSPGKPTTEYISGDIVFHCQAVLDYSEFEALIPEIKPGRILKRGSIKDEPDTDDPKFKDAINRRAEQQTHWMILKSLEATPNLEWETVQMDKPETWGNFKKELNDAGFTEVEINRLVMGVASANGLDQDKMDEAKRRFLRTRGVGQV